MGKVSVLIPARNERYLTATVVNVLAQARGEIEVVVVLEGYWPDPPLPDDPRVVVLHHPEPCGMRTSLNDAALVARGDYLMKLDAHCALGEGFDVTLAADCPKDWIMAPRRYSLEPEGWTIREGRPVVDYEYIGFPYAPTDTVKTSNKWYERAEARRHILVDENMCCQGSCLFIPRPLFDRIGPFQTEGYGEFILDTEEMTNKAWLVAGTGLLTDKNTWYAHLHKEHRGYFMDKKPLQRGRVYHTDMWMHNRWPGQMRPFSWLVEHFWPIPKWPESWQQGKWERAWRRRCEGAE